MSRFPFAALACLVLLAGCSSSPDEGPPLGMKLAQDGVIYAGAAVIDITPAIGETFTDVNGNHDFDGCIDDPFADGDGCDEPFDDANGNGKFDPVWIGGFGPLRPALGVHDPIYVRAVVLSYDETYMAIAAIDVVGLGTPRIHEARDRLVADGFEQDRLLVASTHNHQGPDTMGLWGDPENFVSGLDRTYQEHLADSIETAVRQAAAAMVPVTLRIGRTNLRDVEPKWYNGADFGGENPDHIMHGLIHDGRDPIVISDQLLVVQGVGADDGTVFTLTNWSGHPETRSSSNNDISSDYPGTLRDLLEAQLGGVAIDIPERLGGMQSALGGDVPLVDENGEHQYQSCDAAAVADAMDTQCYGLAVGDPRVDADGDRVPAWAERNSWHFTRSLGYNLAEAALGALDQGEVIQAAPMRVEAENFYVPIENSTYNLLAPFDIFELGLDNAVFDPGSPRDCRQQPAARLHRDPHLPRTARAHRAHGRARRAAARAGVGTSRGRSTLERGGGRSHCARKRRDGHLLSATRSQLQRHQLRRLPTGHDAGRLRLPSGARVALRAVVRRRAAPAARGLERHPRRAIPRGDEHDRQLPELHHSRARLQSSGEPARRRRRPLRRHRVAGPRLRHPHPRSPGPHQRPLVHPTVTLRASLARSL